MISLPRHFAPLSWFWTGMMTFTIPPLFYSITRKISQGASLQELSIPFIIFFGVAILGIGIAFILSVPLHFLIPDHSVSQAFPDMKLAAARSRRRLAVTAVTVCVWLAVFLPLTLPLMTLTLLQRASSWEMILVNIAHHTLMQILMGLLCGCVISWFGDRIRPRLIDFRQRHGGLKV